MTPGKYLRLRREASGLSIADVAVIVSPTIVWRRFNRAAIEAHEADACMLSPTLVNRMRGAFRFDVYIVRQLACNIGPLPPICTTCGCSDLDACHDEHCGSCAWATPARDFCTCCQRKALERTCAA